MLLILGELLNGNICESIPLRNNHFHILCAFLFVWIIDIKTEAIGKSFCFLKNNIQIIIKRTISY